MFRQINIHEDNWKYQRIIWHDQHLQPITYELTTVTYGLVCAPFLSLRVLQQLTLDEGSNFPKAVSTMIRGRYVDDLFGGADSVSQAQELVIQLNQLCMAGGFLPKKWISNENSVLNSLPSTDLLETTDLLIDNNILVHSLGLSWHPVPDQFHFINGIKEEKVITKRVMLSMISKIFDPLGFLSPVTITAKLLIQELWTKKLDWDETLPPDIIQKWTNFVNDSQGLSQLEFPRWIGTSSTNSMELHGFCDASLNAMAAVIFCRNTTSDGQINIRFVCAKTKVAPLKRLTIPRLELTEAVLLTKLVARVLTSLHKKEVKIYLWTDSTITLTWVTGHPSQWKDFVHNRVVFIQDTLPIASWRFVPGLENPADLATRGVTPSHLLELKTWWHGPDWLAQPSQCWPTTPHKNLDEAQLEKRSMSVATTSTLSSQPWDLLDKYSSLNKLLRITTVCQRAIKCFKRLPNSSLKHPISPVELKQAKEFWIKEVQRHNLSRELKVISSGNSLHKSNSMVRLTPFIDAKGILRVGGRLDSSDLSYEAKHPAIIPKRSAFTTLIISEAHLRSLHGGTQLTTSLLREEFWIIGGRATIRSHIHNCVTCTRSRKTRAQQLMGQLPPERVHPSRPFLNTGVDYAGPFLIKTWRGKNARIYKGYVALFVCFSTSAIHLELVTDYSTDAFMAAYKRFSSRRGICATLISDCGTNFKGADAELQRLFSAATEESHRLASLLAQDGTHWKFNPPSAPHQGGKWEAGVKSMKNQLKKVLGDHLLTFEEMTTLLTQIEAVLNSRPLCPITDDPEDLTALTPGHFIMGCAPTVIPEPSLEEEKITRLSRWQLLRKMLDTFWSKWSNEYLKKFHSTYKWNKSTTSIKEGSMVLIADERLPPAKWPLGRVVQVHPGRDGLIRVVTVKTQTSEYIRPITKLCPLPIDDNVTSLFINYEN